MDPKQICFFLCAQLYLIQGGLSKRKFDGDDGLDLAKKIVGNVPKSGIGGNIGGDKFAGRVAKVATKQLKELFGEEMNAEPLLNVVNDGIKCPSDLDCNFSEETCKWQNFAKDGRSVTTHTLKGTGEPDREKQFFAYTGGDNYDAPESPYGMMVGRPKERRSNDVWYVSAPVNEQKGNGTLYLRPWSTPGSSFEICTRDLTKRRPKLENCSPAVAKCPKASGNSKKLLEIFNIPEPAKTPFQIVIKGSFNRQSGGFHVFDDIAYRSSLCGNTQSACNDSGSELKERPTTVLATQPPRQAVTQPQQPQTEAVTGRSRSKGCNGRIERLCNRAVAKGRCGTKSHFVTRLCVPCGFCR